jgi:hypothetical protein
MYFVRIGEYFEIFWQGFSEIVLQIPLETAIFTERILRKERATLFELTCASISVTGRESARACTRAKSRARLVCLERAGVHAIPGEFTPLPFYGERQ